VNSKIYIYNQQLQTYKGKRYRILRRVVMYIVLAISSMTLSTHKENKTHKGRKGNEESTFISMTQKEFEKDTTTQTTNPWCHHHEEGGRGADGQLSFSLSSLLCLAMHSCCKVLSHFLYLCALIYTSSVKVLLPQLAVPEGRSNDPPK